MIKDLIQAVAATLKQVDNRRVYFEDIPQGFEMPAWMVAVSPQAISRGINGRRKNTAQIYVAYIPDDKTLNKKLLCAEIGEQLGRFDMMGDFHVSERTITITDNVLHFDFTVNYTEVPVIDDAKMQTMDYDLTNKEE